MLVPLHWLIVARRFQTALGTDRPVMRRNITEERRSLPNCLDFIVHVYFFKEQLYLECRGDCVKNRALSVNRGFQTSVYAFLYKIPGSGQLHAVHASVWHAADWKTEESWVSFRQGQEILLFSRISRPYAGAARSLIQLGPSFFPWD